MSDWIFAFFHLFLLLGVVGYTFFSLFQGNTYRFLVLLACLALYYFLVLHKAVMKEIRRKRKKVKP